MANVTANRTESSAAGRAGDGGASLLPRARCGSEKEHGVAVAAKVHFFIRGLDEMVVAFDGSATDPKPELFLSLKEAKEKFGGRHDDSFFPVLTCKSCGQHFFERHYKDLDYARGARKQIKDFENGNARRTQTARAMPCGLQRQRKQALGGADQSPAGRSRWRPECEIIKIPEGVLLLSVRGHAPGTIRTMPRRRVQESRTTVAHDGLQIRVGDVPIVQLAGLPNWRANHRADPQSASGHGGRCSHPGPGDD